MRAGRGAGWGFFLLEVVACGGSASGVVLFFVIVPGVSFVLVADGGRGLSFWVPFLSNHDFYHDFYHCQASVLRVDAVLHGFASLQSAGAYLDFALGGGFGWEIGVLLLPGNPTGKLHVNRNDQLPGQPWASSGHPH